MSFNPSVLALVSAFGVSPLTSAQAAVLLGNAADATYSVPRALQSVIVTTYDAGTSGTASVVLQNASTTDNVLQTGATSANSAIATAIIPFVLPTLNAGESFADATFSIGQSSASNAQQFDLYGLGSRATSAVVPSDYYRGLTGGDTTDATLIQGAFVSTSDTFAAGGITTTNAAGNLNLAAWLNSQYAMGAGAGQTVFLRMNVTETYSTANTRLSPHAVESATASLRPQITYAVVPEPASLTLALLGLTGALARRRSR